MQNVMVADRTLASDAWLATFLDLIQTSNCRLNVGAMIVESTLNVREESLVTRELAISAEKHQTEKDQRPPCRLTDQLWMFVHHHSQKT